MNKYGQAGKVSYDPRVLLLYVTYKDIRGERTDAWRDSPTGRTIRRWSKTKGVTEQSAASVLACYTEGEKGFEEFCERNGLDPIRRRR